MVNRRKREGGKQTGKREKGKGIREGGRGTRDAGGAGVNNHRFFFSYKGQRVGRGDESY